MRHNGQRSYSASIMQGNVSSEQQMAGLESAPSREQLGRKPGQVPASCENIPQAGPGRAGLVLLGRAGLLSHDVQVETNSSR